MNRIRVRVKQLGDCHFQVNLSERGGIVTQTLLRAGKGGRLARCKAIYLGFDSYNSAIDAANEIRAQFPKARIAVRKAERLSTAWEVKVSHEAAEMIAWNWLKAYSQTTSVRVTRHLAAVASRPSLLADAPASRLRSSLDRYPSTPRHTGRTTVATSDGRLIGIE